jgi:hypothetical protein
MSLILVAPSAITVAIETRTIPQSSRATCLLPQRCAQVGGQSCLVGGLAEEYRVGVADQAGPAAGDLQCVGPSDGPDGLGITG